MSIYFTSDTHYWHNNILRFCKKTRPFNTVEEMNLHLIRKSQEIVQPDDDFWFLGDCFFGSPERARAVLDQLPGRKHLILGNHDKVIQKNRDIWNRFETVQEYKEITINKQPIILFHFPIAEWNRMHHGSWHLHGHTHGSYVHEGKALDVGIDGAATIDCGPVSVEQIAAYMKNRPILSHH